MVLDPCETWFATHECFQTYTVKLVAKLKFVVGLTLAWNQKRDGFPMLVGINVQLEATKVNETCCTFPFWRWLRTRKSMIRCTDKQHLYFRGLLFRVQCHARHLTGIGRLPSLNGSRAMLEHRQQDQDLQGGKGRRGCTQFGWSHRWSKGKAICKDCKTNDQRPHAWLQGGIKC